MLDTQNTTRVTTVPVAELTKALTLLSKVIDKRMKIPSLHTVRIGEGYITATDLDIEVSLQADVTGPHFLVDLADVQKAVKGADRGHLAAFSITPAEDSAAAPVVTLEADGLTSAITAYPITDWPPMPAPSGPHASYEMGAEYIREMLSFAGSAVSTEETRYYLCGTFLTAFRGCLTAVATDGHRMAVFPTAENSDILTDTPEFHQDGVILPSKASKLVLAAVGTKPVGTVALSLRPKQIVLRGEGWLIRSKVIDGTFPDFTRIFPRTNKHVCLDRVKTEKAVTRLSGVIDGPLVVDTADLDTGAPEGVLRSADKNQSMPLPTIAGKGEFALGVNPKYLLDALKAFDCDSVHMSVGGDCKPFRISQHGSDLDKFFVIMPMRH